MPEQVPVQPVEKPILCNPYEEPRDYWLYDPQTGEAKHGGERRPAGYWYKTDRVGAAQARLFMEEERDDLPLVNALRNDVRRWRESGYRGASTVTKDLLKHWGRADKLRRLFFCQMEAAETIIYLAEIRMPGRSARTLFKDFDLSDENLRKLLKGERASLGTVAGDFFPTLIDKPADETLLPLTRMACKMATGSGKTVVMAMVIAWAFCNRALNPGTKEFPGGVLICCPNLTVKERLQVLQPDAADNYYDAFEIVPSRYRTALHSGKVLVTNWHAFAPESEHKEGDSTYAVVDKGAEPADVFAKRVLGDLYDRLPIMVMNDEGHHCWRPAPDEDEVDTDEKAALEEEVQEATVWVEGLDKINNSMKQADGSGGIRFCIDMSATPFYIYGSGHPEGRPFPWVVSDFGLVDAIESGITKIPRLPVSDVTGRPEAKYFRLWKSINESLQPREKMPGRSGRPKPEVAYREAQAALQQIAGQWLERFQQIQEAKPGQEVVPPVLIIVCDNTDIASVFYSKISGEREEEIVTEEDVAEVAAEVSGAKTLKGKKKAKKKQKTIVYERGDVFPDYFSNTPEIKRTFRIDSKLLAQAESEDPTKKKSDAAEEIRKIVATVGKPGQPGQYIRCVVSVGMLTEGWDANNVTHILGIRAFGSQLLCEQVVGRGLRRMDYVPDPTTGKLTEEYVDVYGIPFSVIPFKGRPVGKTEPIDKPKNHVKSMEERVEMEIRFPVVEGFAVSLRKNLITCDITKMEPLRIEPSNEPTATFVRAAAGYQEGLPAHKTTPFPFIEQNRHEFYEQSHIQSIMFEIARQVVEQLASTHDASPSQKNRVLKLCSRHQLFPQVYRYVEEYVGKKVDFRGVDQRELGLQKYVVPIVERLRDAIEPDASQGEPPVMPVLNRYKPIGTTADVDFKTTKPVRATAKSHINQVVCDTVTWEEAAAFRLEQSRVVKFYAKNDHLGFVIPYEWQGIDYSYEPDFIVRLSNDISLVLEIKGFEDEQTRAKHTAAKKWVSAVNNWGRLGGWAFHVCRDPQLLGKELGHLVQV